MDPWRDLPERGPEPPDPPRRPRIRDAAPFPLAAVWRAAGLSVCVCGARRSEHPRAGCAGFRFDVLNPANEF